MFEQVLDTDFWVVVPIESLLRPGEHLEGTRLTLVRLMDQPDSFELSIRTPVTPHRWKAFDQVLGPRDTYRDVRADCNAVPQAAACYTSSDIPEAWQLTLRS